MSRKVKSTKELFLLALLALTLNHIKEVSSVKIINNFLDSENLCWNQPDYTRYRDVHDCSKYLECLDGEIKIQSCPNGWFYNSKLKLCDDNTDYECLIGSTINETTATITEECTSLCKDKLANSTLPYPKDCQWYYFCGGNGLNYLLSCPNNNYYDPYSGNCGPHVSPTACQDSTTTTTTISTTLSPNEKCVDQGVGKTYPYKENCQQYIYCNGKGGFLLINCPYNNYYYPDSGDCGPSEDPEICLKEFITTEATTTIETPTSLSPGEKCVDQGLGSTYPYEENCQKYVYCNGKGGYFILNCPNNNYYDPYTGDCGPPELVSPTACRDLGTSTTFAATTLSPSEKCVDQSVGTTYPYKENCQQYIYCNGKGGFLLINCPYNNYYYPNSGDCEPSDDSEICLKDSITTEATTTIETPTTLSPGEKCMDQGVGTTYPYEENCQQYIYCNGKGGFFILNCHNNNYYDPYTGDCGPPELVSPTACIDLGTSTTVAATTLSPSEKCVDQSVGTTYPYKENCQQYIYCNGKGGFLLINCPYNNYYYPDSGDCGPSEDPEICLKEFITTEATTTIETPTSLSPGEKCVDQGLGSTYPYEENCQKYVYCNGKGGYFILNCPKNNYYDPYTGDCGPPELVSPTACRDLGTGTTFAATTLSPSEKCVDQNVGTTYPYKENCQQYIYCNGKGGFLLISCPYNNYYYPDSGDCGPSDDSEICLKDSITTEATTTIETPTTLSPGEKCMDQGVGTTYPYEKNCQQYIYCNGKGGFFILNCPNNNYYDPYTGDCGPPELVSPTACIDLGTSTTVAATTLSPSEKCVDQSVGTTYPYKENCQQYIYCNGKGGFLLINCPYNNYYYPDSGDCGPSDDSEICLKESITTEATTTIETPTSLSPGEKCDDQGLGTTYPYEENCQQYIYCNGKVGFFILNCPKNNYYDPYTGDCGPPELVSPTACKDFGTTTTIAATTLSPSEKCVDQGVGTTYPYKENCQQYIYCNGKGGFFILNCPYNNYYYPDSGNCGPSDDPEVCLRDLTTTKASTTSTATTLSPSEKCVDQVLATTYAYEENCQQYIYCNGKGGFLILNCPYNNYYFPDSGDCGPSDDPEICQKGSTTITPTSTNTTQITPEASSSVCIDQPDFTTLSYPEDCHRYYFCTGNGLYYLLTCRQDNYYDPSLGICGPSELVSSTACQDSITTNFKSW